MVGKEARGVHDITFQSIMDYDVDTRKNPYADVVLSEGMIMSTGIAARMTKRENALALCAVTIKGVALAETQSTANEAIGIQKSDVQTKIFPIGNFILGHSFDDDDGGGSSGHLFGRSPDNWPGGYHHHPEDPECV